jgi:hypothetical protein
LWIIATLAINTKFAKNNACKLCGPSLVIIEATCFRVRFRVESSLQEERKEARRRREVCCSRWFVASICGFGLRVLVEEKEKSERKEASKQANKKQV